MLGALGASRHLGPGSARVRGAECGLGRCLLRVVLFVAFFGTSCGQFGGFVLFGSARRVCMCSGWECKSVRWCSWWFGSSGLECAASCWLWSWRGCLARVGREFGARTGELGRPPQRRGLCAWSSAWLSWWGEFACSCWRGWECVWAQGGIFGARRSGRMGAVGDGCHAAVLGSMRGPPCRLVPSRALRSSWTWKLGIGGVLGSCGLGALLVLGWRSCSCCFGVECVCAEVGV